MHNSTLINNKKKKCWHFKCYRCSSKIDPGDLAISWWASVLFNWVQWRGAYLTVDVHRNHMRELLEPWPGGVDMLLTVRLKAFISTLVIPLLPLSSFSPYLYLPTLSPSSNLAAVCSAAVITVQKVACTLHGSQICGSRLFCVTAAEVWKDKVFS